MTNSSRLERPSAPPEASATIAAHQGARREGAVLASAGIERSYPSLALGLGWITVVLLAATVLLRGIAGSPVPEPSRKAHTAHA